MKWIDGNRICIDMQSGFWDGHQLSPACADEYAQARSGQMAIQAGISGEILENQVSLKMLFLRRLDRERILNDL